MTIQQKKWPGFQYYLSFFLIIVSLPSVFALQEDLFEGSSNIETVFDAATSFTIPLIIFLSLSHGMNVYLFFSFFILAIADMGLTTLFTYFCYRHYKDHFFWIYFIFIETIYIAKYALTLKESRFFNKLLDNTKEVKDKRNNLEVEKMFKKLLLPMVLYITNFIFLGFAIHRGYVDLVNGLFVIVPSIILFLFFVIFVSFRSFRSFRSKKRWDRSVSVSHLRFSVEFVCLVIFVMISGPSPLWTKAYLAITLVESSLYLERAKNVKENDEEGGLQNELNKLEEFIKNMNMNNEKQGKNRVVLEINIKVETNEEGNEEKENNIH